MAIYLGGGCVSCSLVARLSFSGPAAGVWDNERCFKKDFLEFVFFTTPNDVLSFLAP